MAGIIIPIVRKQMFNFGYLGNAATKIVTLYTALNAVPYTSGRLLVRLHDRSMSSGQVFALAVFGTSPAPDDTTEFTDSSALMTSGNITSVTTSPSLISSTSTNIYPFLKVALSAYQQTGGTDFLVEVSADLILRE